MINEGTQFGYPDVKDTSDWQMGSLLASQNNSEHLIIQQYILYLLFAY
jgi:hypothetical protein